MLLFLFHTFVAIITIMKAKKKEEEIPSSIEYVEKDFITRNTNESTKLLQRMCFHKRTKMKSRIVRLEFKLALDRALRFIKPVFFFQKLCCVSFIVIIHRSIY
jgi:hypothetical protein